MKRHVKIYLDYFGYGIDDFVPCELCNKKAIDIHHVMGRGKGKDVISNLMALCRDCHNKCHGHTHTYLHPDVMQEIHNKFLNKHKN